MESRNINRSLSALQEKYLEELGRIYLEKFIWRATLVDEKQVRWSLVTLIGRFRRCTTW